MIKAVFFDLFQTLVLYDPPREDLVVEVLGNAGIERDPAVFRLPLVAADEFMYGEIASRPLSLRSREEKMALYAEHQRIMLRQAGIEPEDDLVLKLLHRLQQYQMNLVLFDDVIPVLSDLKARGLALGLISNVEQSMQETFDNLGLTSRLDVIVTSQDAGATKPRPEIFREAMRRAGVKPAESIFVGDQYQVDIIGSRGAGMTGILLDRYDYNQDITDCPRINSLRELSNYL